jgi:hypothetical protein
LVKFGVYILKNLTIIFLLVSTLYSSNIQIEQKIYQVILSAIFPYDKHIYVWTDTPEKTDFLNSITNVKVVKTPKEADFLILDHTRDIQSDALKFASSYKMLKYYKKDIIGGFYWQKGRPNILFLRDNLQKKYIKLPESMQEYIENDL